MQVPADTEEEEKVNKFLFFLWMSYFLHGPTLYQLVHLKLHVYLDPLSALLKTNIIQQSLIWA